MAEEVEKTLNCRLQMLFEITRQSPIILTEEEGQEEGIVINNFQLINNKLLVVVQKLLKCSTYELKLKSFKIHYFKLNIKRRYVQWTYILEGIHTSSILNTI